MKKVHLLFISLVCCIFFATAAIAYQTVLIDFPENQGWHSVYYNSNSGESILQYVPAGQTSENWMRTLVFHSYKNLDWTDSSAAFMDRTTMQMESKNSTQLYKYTKYSEMDSISTRCITKNQFMPTQCEIYRVSKSFEGLISMHYINKNVQDFKANYDSWYEIVQDISIYNSYYRDDRIMDKATSFEL